MSLSKVFVSGVVLALAAIGFVPGQLASGTTPPPPSTVVLPAAGATVSGQNVVLDATAPAGTTSVEYFIFTYGGMTHSGLQQPVAYALNPTEYGWIAEWNTTDAPNASYYLYGAAIMNGTSDSDPVKTGVYNVTVDNPLPSVSIGVPSNGAVLRGSEFVDAYASGAAPLTVSFLLTGASRTTYLGESWNPSVGGPDPWGIGWNSATVPNGYYFLEAVVEYPVVCPTPQCRRGGGQPVSVVVSVPG